MAKLYSLPVIAPETTPTETSRPDAPSKGIPTRLKISLATLGLIGVVLALSGFSLWVAFANQAVVQQVKYSDHLNNFFADAHLYMSQEENYVHKYLLSYSAGVKSDYLEAASNFNASLTGIRNSGNAADQTLAVEILAAHDKYVAAVNSLFAAGKPDALTQGNPNLRANIENTFGNLAGIVTRADADHQTLADSYLAKLDQTQTFIFVATPVVLMIGVLLIVLCWLFLQNYQRQSVKDKLANERLQAVNETIATALAKEKELHDLKTRFISVTSHEFKSPLTAIYSSVELLERYRAKLTEQKQQEVLGRIKTSVRDMSNLVNNVLEIGKTEAGKLGFNPAQLDLTRFCAGLVKEAQLGARGKVTINFTNSFPNIVGLLDEKLLRHIVTNLLSNAVKYSPQGSTVNFELIRQFHEVVLRVADQGIGIPPEDHAQLFEEFHRAGNVNSIPGTGLGLSIVKQAVDAHNGYITFTSEIGAGSCFTVRIPLDPEYRHFSSNIESATMLMALPVLQTRE